MAYGSRVFRSYRRAPAFGQKSSTFPEEEGASCLRADCTYFDQMLARVDTQRLMRLLTRTILLTTDHTPAPTNSNTTSAPSSSFHGITQKLTSARIGMSRWPSL